MRVRRLCPHIKAGNEPDIEREREGGDASEAPLSTRTAMTRAATCGCANAAHAAGSSDRSIVSASPVTMPPSVQTTCARAGGDVRPSIFFFHHAAPTYAWQWVCWRSKVYPYASCAAIRNKRVPDLQAVHQRLGRRMRCRRVATGGRRLQASVHTLPQLGHSGEKPCAILCAHGPEGELRPNSVTAHEGWWLVVEAYKAFREISTAASEWVSPCDDAFCQGLSATGVIESHTSEPAVQRIVA
jgi:hypothetical protein